MQDKKVVSILGCGWYGFSLATALIDKGLSIKGSTTSSAKLDALAAAGIEPYLVDFSADSETYEPKFFDCDSLWISIPPKIREGNGEEYLKKMDRIANAIIRHNVKQVVFISSTGVYGDLNKEVTELSEARPDSESGKALLKAENMLKQQMEFTTTIIRFAGLIGPGRDPGRFMAGKKNVPNGNAPVNLIHLTDCIGISCAILDKGVFGYTYNACSPDHPKRSDFYTKAVMRLGLEAPEFITEKKSWKIVSGINVNRLLEYKYIVDDLMGWLDNK